MENKLKNILVLVVALISLSVRLAHTMDQRFYQSYDLYEETLTGIFRSGDNVTPLLLEWFKADLNDLSKKNSDAVERLARALILLGGVEPFEVINLLSEAQSGSLRDICSYPTTISSSKCSEFIGVRNRDFQNELSALGLSGRKENMQYLDALVKHREKIKRQEPNPSSDFERWDLKIEGARNWLKRGGAQFTQPAGMPDEEAVWQLMIEFLGAFERKIPWLILKESEKGKPVKPHHRVSYYKVEKEVFTPEGREGRIWQTRQLLSPHGVESRRPVWKIMHEIEEQEKMVPIEILSDDLVFNPDRTRILVRIKYRDHDWGNIDGYTFLFWRIEGKWQFRFAEGKSLVVF